MTKDNITTRQAEKIYAALTPTLGFLTQLESRLTEVGFQATDGYYERVRAARAAFLHLTTETHALTRESRVGEAVRR